MIPRIGDIVRAVRARTQCSLEDLAQQSDVPVSVIEALEQGRSAITTTQLERVATALALDPTALLQEREVSRPIPSVFLRHEPVQDFDDADAHVLDEALEQGRSLASLRSCLSEPVAALQAGIFSPREAATDRPDAPAQDGYRLAREVREWLGEASEPIGDMRSLIESQFGIAVLVCKLQSPRVTAAAVRAEAAAAVVLSASDAQRAVNPLLARVNLAHELCHVLFDPSSPGKVHIIVDVAIDRKSYASEQRARAFAAELLLPHTGLTDLLGASRGVADRGGALDMVARVRSRFGAHHDITANHLCNLRFIDRKLRDWLEAAKTPFTAGSPRTTLPETDAPSRLVAEYVERAHREGILTDGEARSILKLDRLAPLPWDEVSL